MALLSHPVLVRGSNPINWSGIVGPTRRDWLAIYTVGAPNTQPTAWRYTTGAAAGILPLWLPPSAPAGSYEVRLFGDGNPVPLDATTPYATALGPPPSTPVVGAPEVSDLTPYAEDIVAPEWHIYVGDASGRRLAELDVSEWDYERRVSQVGAAHLRCSLVSPNLADLWQLGHTILVQLSWRKAGEPWQHREDWGGWLLTRGLRTPEGGRAEAAARFTAYHWLHLLRGATLVPSPGTEYVDLDAAQADVAIKRAVRLGLTDPGPPEWRHPLQPTCADDLAQGGAVSYSARFERLYDVVATLAGVGQVKFDMVRDRSSGALQFQTFAPLRGVDRTADNAAGNPPAVFDVDLSTVGNLDYTDDASALGNAVWVGGQGEGEARALDFLEDPLSIALYGRWTTFVDARTASTEAARLTAGEAALTAHAVPEPTVQFGVPATGGLMYARDWDLGDKVTVRVADVGATLHAEVVSLKVSRGPEDAVPRVVPTIGVPVRTFVDRIAELSRGLRVRQAV